MKGKARKIVLAVLVMAVLSALGGCVILMGEDGAVYGSYDFDNTTLLVYNWEDSGFPTPIENTMWGDYYKFQPGSYSFQYQIYYSGYWYPDAAAWPVEYTVTVNEGELLADGDDKYFDLWLSRSYGPYQTGLNIKGMGIPSVQPDGTQIYVDGRYTISLKVGSPVPIEGQIGQSLTK